MFLKRGEPLQEVEQEDGLFLLLSGRAFERQCCFLRSFLLQNVEAAPCIAFSFGEEGECPFSDHPIALIFCLLASL